MSLRPEDVQRIAHLARLAITEEETQRTLVQLNDIFGMIERMRAVDTEGVVPMSHPLGGAQRLRADAVTDVPDRERNRANAPARQDGLFLVPRVLE
jgi:aspartyl-tRNA(Asn)/glutamyl-tRNA(Gln) amidotransferase subunit C